MPLSDFPGLSATARSPMSLSPKATFATRQSRSRPCWTSGSWPTPLELKGFSESIDMLEDWSQWQEEILYGEFVGGRQTWVGMGRAWTSHFGSSRDDERHGLRGPGATELAGAAASLGHVRGLVSGLFLPFGHRLSSPHPPLLLRALPDFERMCLSSEVAIFFMSLGLPNS